MALILILIGAVLVMAAYENSQAQLVAALESDLPGYFTWAAAIFGVSVLGWIPGFQPIAHMLLLLVLVVLVMTNYSQILAGFKAAYQGGAATQTATTDPAQQYASAVSGQYAQGGAINGAIAGQVAQGSFLSSPIQTASSAIGSLTGGLF